MSQPLDLFTTKQAAQFLSISLCRLQNLITAGKLPATKLGQDYLISRADMENIAPKIRRGGRTSNPGMNYINRNEKRSEDE